MVAEFTQEIFTDDNLENSSSIYKAIRDAGDVVWSQELEMHIVSRFDDVKKGLIANEQLISSEGVTLNANLSGPNAPPVISTIQSDGELHKRFKHHSMKPLTAPAISELKDKIALLADTQIKALLDKEITEGIETLAFFLPVNIVCDLVGINGADSKRMQNWSDAMFNSTGPTHHPRTLSNMHGLMDFRSFMEPITRDDLTPGGWADQLMAASERGELSEAEARGVMMDYIVPSLDTTAQATAEMLYQLATNPEDYQRICENPELIPSTVLESVRMATPIRGFTRLLVEDFTFSETTLPKGSRVWLLNAAANRDERHYTAPENFDIERNPRDQLSWGFGAHMCIGMHLAKLEMESLLRALVQHVKHIEVESPKRLIHNMIQGYESLPIKLVSR